MSEQGQAPPAPSEGTGGVPSAAGAGAEAQSAGEGSAAETSANASAVASAVTDSDGNAIDLAGPDGDRPFTLTVAGEKITKPLREWANGMMLSKAARRKMQGAAETERRAQSIIDAVRTNPARALSELGPEAIEEALVQLVRTASDDKTPAEQRAAVERAFKRIMKEAERSPEELERDAYKREREAFEKERDAYRKEREEEQTARLAKQHQRAYTKSFGDALTKAGLSATPEHMVAMAAHARELHELGLPLDAAALAECAALVAEEQGSKREAGAKSLLSLSPAELAKALGAEKMAELRKWDLDQVRAPALPKTAPPAEKPAPATKATSMDDFEARMDAWRAKKRAG